jgi:hypothetical protein
MRIWRLLESFSCCLSSFNIAYRRYSGRLPEALGAALGQTVVVAVVLFLILKLISRGKKMSVTSSIVAGFHSIKIPRVQSYVFGLSHRKAPMKKSLNTVRICP